MIKIALLISSILLVSSLVAQVEARNITGFIHLNEQVIEEKDSYLGEAWFTVDGKNYSNWYYDLSEAAYGSYDYNGHTDDVLEKELMVADNASKICLEDYNTDDPDYKVCSRINNATEVHFMYPASWQPELTTTTTTRNITAFIHLNEEVIKDGGSLEHTAWYTVDGKNYSNWHHDMIEMVYPDEANSGPIYDTWEDELTVADNASEICYQDVGDYKSCALIDNATTEIHFSYPAAAD